MTIWDRIEDALEGLNLPMAESDYVVESQKPFPDAYMVYFLITSVPAQFFDNEEKNRNYHVQINYFDRDGLAGMPDISGAMTADGFTRGPTLELPKSQETGHCGMALEFWYCE